MFLRLLAIILHCLYGLMLCVSFGFISPARKQQLVLRWHQSALRIFRLNVVVKGADISSAFSGPRLIVANHISWLDIHVLASQAPITFVAKSDVMSWPVFGIFAKSAGTIFLNRNQANDIKRVLKEMSSHFETQETICIFPEGTSSDGKGILPFKSNLFQAVVDTEIPVTPILIQYQLHGKFTEVPAYYGDMTLVKSILSMLKTPQITALIEVLPEAPPQDSRQMFSHMTHEALQTALQPPHP